jgi:regulator of RNase E activity RraA
MESIMSIGFKVLKRRRAVGAEWIEKFKSLPVANISDVMNRLTAGGPRLRPYHASGVLCGAALTVKSRPGDNLMAHMALTMVQAGDVIVVDAGGDLTNSIIGERMMVSTQRRGAAGWVIDGAIRDLEWVKKNTLPVFAAGISHRGPYKTGPGEINVPIAIDGMVIEPGDLIVGDDDGLLCIPFDDLEAVYKMAHAKHASESSTFDAIGRGDQSEDRAMQAAQLKAMGCYIEE